MKHETEPIVRLQDVRVSYVTAATRIEALRGISLEVFAGELVSVMGPSGSGKTTLLNVIGGLEPVSAGSVQICGRSIDNLSDRQMSELRRTDIAYVFQFFNLLSTLTVIENVSVPLRAAGRRVSESFEIVSAVLERVGLAHRSAHLPQQLSGGEMQRVAIARALVSNSRLILADEPTGNLDSTRGDEIMNMFRDVVEDGNCSVLMVTHDPRAAAHGDRMILLRDGRIEDELKGATAGADVEVFPKGMKP